MRGRAQSITGDTRKEAQQRPIEALAERGRAGGTVCDDALTVGELLDRYLASTEGTVKVSTFSQYKPALGHLRLSKLNPGHLEVLYQSWADGGAGASTVRSAHAIIRAALGRAVRWGLRANNPAEVVSPPKVRPPEVKLLSSEQAKRFLAAAEGDDLEALWSVLLTAGLRIGEAVATWWEDADLDTGTLRVGRTLSWKVGEGPYLDTPKAGQGRNVHLTARAVEALRRHRVQHAEQRLAAPSVDVAQQLPSIHSCSMLDEQR